MNAQANSDFDLNTLLAEMWEGTAVPEPAVPTQKPPAALANTVRKAVAPVATTSSSELARQRLKQFTDAGTEFFAEVAPPELTELNLRNSRVLSSRGKILPFLPKGGICAEVGTQTGGFAKHILSVLRPAKLHLYDMDFTPFDHAHFQPAIQQGQVELHEGDSSTQLAAMPDGHFDFIYIDGDHSYECVARDLEHAARKLKADGWIVCNDYTPYSPLEKITYGVYRAVNEFCLERGFEIIYLGLHPWGYHDVALRKHAHLGGAFLDVADPNTFLPDVWEYLVEKYQIKSVLDVGAGAGWSTKWFLDHGLEAQGVEGWPEALERSQCRANIVEHDYTRAPFVPVQPFDLCWCSEFVEHIEEQFIPNFMASFRACKFVCLTHGEIGQVGYHHVNCQTTDYWVEKMKQSGFELDAEETTHLRATDTNNAPWGRRTLTFFRNTMTPNYNLSPVSTNHKTISSAAPGQPVEIRPVNRLQIGGQGQLGQESGTGVIQKIGTGDEMFTGDTTHYFGVGKSALRCIEAGLFAAAKEAGSVRRILDLPCGHGRVMRHLKAAFPRAQLTACDLNRGAVDFCAQTFGAQPVYSATNIKSISLPGRFDLIWCGSLLTHLRAVACAEFVRFFRSLLNPGGLMIVTLHGRWVERSLATGRYKYGLPDPSVAAILMEYRQTGFGYADYPNAAEYGISVSSPAFVLAQLVSLPDLRLVSYHEKGWDNHQDAVCLLKQFPDELLG